TGVGVESTVVDVTGPHPVVLRPGGVSVEALEGLVGRVTIDPAVEGKPLDGPARSPGMTYRHYAPQAPALPLAGAPAAIARPGVGVASTVVDVTGPHPVVLRPGGVSVEALEGLVGRVTIDPAVEGKPLDGPARSPGMKYRHYAPQAPALLLEGSPEAIARRVVELAWEAAREGRRVGAVVMAEEGSLLEGRLPDGAVVRILASRDAPEEAAHRLYGALRAMDRLGVDRVLLAAPEARGVGLAVRDRMYRAAGWRVEQV